MDTTIVPFLNHLGKPYQYVAIRSDITERKKGEEQIEQSNKRAIEHAKDLEIKNMQLVDFCNIVSHNLRAPLINISMLVDYMDQAIDDEEKKEIQSKIKPVVNHLMDVFNELVESIQIKQDTKVEQEYIVLKDCIDKILVGYEAQIKAYDATVQLDFDKDIQIYYSPKYLESILGNLISNSLRYKSPDRKPVITINAERTDNHSLLLSVEDNGLGIDLVLHKDQIFKIRKTFHRHPDSKGFGLFMIKTQVDAMNGRIWAESTVDEGSTFFIEFKNQNE